MDEMLIDDNEEIIKEISKEFKNETFQPSKRVNSTIQSIRNDRKRSDLGDALSTEGFTTKSNDALDREQHGGDGRRSSQKSNIFEIRRKHRGQSPVFSLCVILFFVCLIICWE